MADGGPTFVGDMTDKNSITEPLDDRVLIRAELVRRKQAREAHDGAAKELDLETARAIRRARELGVSLTEAADFAGVTRMTAYKLLGRLETHEQKAKAA
jgi:DNA invertase Pin-like site-specific DNA recombinase